MPYRILEFSCIYRSGQVDPSTINDTDSRQQEIMSRIRKILDRGLHPNTQPAEAARSMRLAQEAMTRHNISRAQIMSGNERDVEFGGAAYRVVIEVSRRERWISQLVSACNYFGVKSYRQRLRNGSAIGYVFYGLATSVEAAATAFKLFVEQVPAMKQRYSPPGLSGTALSDARATYRNGLCDGLAQEVHAHVRAERDRIAKLEARAEQLRLLMPPPPRQLDDISNDSLLNDVDDEFLDDEDDDSDDDDDDYNAQPVSDAPEEELSRIENELEANRAVVAYTHNLPAQVLQAMGVTLSTNARRWQPSARSFNQRDYSAGKRDAKRVRLV